jgi:integrase
MPKRLRRGRSEASIYQRKSDGRWVVTLSLGSDDAGRRKRVSRYGARKSEVLAKLDELRREVREGEIAATAPAVAPGTLKAYLESWLRDSVKPTVRESTYLYRESAVRLFIVPAIGSRPLRKVSAEDVRRLYRKMDADAVGGRTRLKVHAALRRAFSQAIRARLIVSNPMVEVDGPRHVAAEIRPLTRDQAAAFLDAVSGDRLEALYVLAIYTGLRQGELFALRWDDIDLRAGELHVRRTTSEVGGAPRVLDSPKTRSSRRPISLAAAAVDALREHRKRAMSEAGGAFVFTDSDGNLLRRSNLIRRSFLPLLERAGLPRIRFHDLRHTFATLLLGSSVHPKIAQEMLGHAKISTTLDTYSHVLPSMQKEAVAALDLALPRRSKRSP